MGVPLIIVMTDLIVGGAVRNMVTSVVHSLTLAEEERQPGNGEEDEQRHGVVVGEEVIQARRRRRYLTPPKPCRVLVFSFCLMLLFLSFYLIHLLLQYIIKLVGDLDWLDKVKEIYTIYRASSRLKNETDLFVSDGRNK